MKRRVRKIIVYLDAAGEWRWKLIARNERIVGASSEGYETRQGCAKDIVDNYGSALVLGWVDFNWVGYRERLGAVRGQTDADLVQHQMNKRSDLLELKEFLTQHGYWSAESGGEA